MQVLLCVAAVLGLTQAGRDTLRFESQLAQTWPPSFCNGLDCPRFNIVNGSHPDYEERKYVASKWVTTELSGIDFDVATYKMFMKLFQYISGNNKAGQKIAMTCPVITRIVPGQGPACENNFTMSFYLAIDNPPAPNADDVYLSSLPRDMDVYVRSYGGFSSKTKFLAQAGRLANDLEKSGSTYQTKYYYTAGYDSPFKFLNRHNEVWFLKK